MNKLLTILCLSILSSLNGFAQLDTVFIVNYNSGDYKAASLNYTGLVGNDDFYYFANENGILKYDGSRWEVITIKDFVAVYSMDKTDAGRIYVGGKNEIGYVEKINGEYQYTSLSEEFKFKRQYNEFWQLEIVDDEVYFCSYEGIIHYDGEKITEIPAKNMQIFLIEGKILLSQFDGGTYIIENDSAIQVNEGPKLRLDGAYAFVPTAIDNEYLMFTSEKGVYSFNIDTYELNKKTIPSSDKLIKSGVYDAIVWRDSLYAVSTWYDGLYFLDFDGNIVKKINKDYGLQTNSLRELFEDQRGNIWIGTDYGVSYIYWSKDLPNNDFEPVTLITDKVFQYSPDSLINSVEFHFATTGYDKSVLQYSYYLEGFDQKFSDWTDETKKEYTNLDGGDYIFHVKARLPDGTETDEAVGTIFIPTPWYLNKWFIAASVLILGGAFIGIYRVRTKRLKRLNKRLELIINNRTRELIDQREQLQSANKELKVINSELDNFVYRSSHDLVAPLKSLKGLVHLAKIDSKDEGLGNYFNKMNNSILKLEEFIKSIMEYSTNTKSEITYETIDLNVVIDGIVDDIRFYDNADKVDLIKEIDLPDLMKTDIKRLNIILSNLITNSIKYHNYNQDNPHIKIKAYNEEDKTIIKVSDNGLGISKDHLKHIFDMFFRASENGEGSGLGLYIVKDTVDMLNGEISVESELEKGTTFTLSLPHK